jgi:prophage regulatory protein
VSTTEILRRDRKRKQERDEERERKRDQRRQRIAESRRRALSAVKAAGLRRILRLPEVEAATGKKRSAIYDGIADGTFPKPVPLGERAVGWIENEILAWQEARIAERDAKIAARPALNKSEEALLLWNDRPRAKRGQQKVQRSGH